MRVKERKKGLWASLDAMPTGTAVMAEWERELGDEFGDVHNFLLSTGEASEDYPCTNRFPCGCPHRVVPHAPDRIVATCDCGCEPIPLKPKDLIKFALDAVKLGEAVRQEFKFHAPSGSATGVRALRIGAHGAARLPVFFYMPQDEAALVDESERLVANLGSPFILLTPTDAHHCETVGAMQIHHAFLVVGLARWLVVAGPCMLKLREPMNGVLTAFEQRLAERTGLAKTVERIDRSMDAMARRDFEQLGEIEELRRLHADGYFKFVLRVDAADFHAFAVIMALGNRKAASVHLEVPHRSFYDRVDKWRSREHAYQLMWRFIEWRKRSSRHIKVRLDESVQSSDAGGSAENPETLREVMNNIPNADSQSYPQLLADILSALRSQNAANWPKVRAEVVKIIEEEIPQ